MLNQTFCPQTASVKGPHTSTCLDVPTGGQYSIRSRAKPVGPIYTGYWSDWSNELTLTGSIPIDTGELTLTLTSEVLHLYTHLIILIVLLKSTKIFSNETKSPPKSLSF